MYSRGFNDLLQLGNIYLASCLSESIRQNWLFQSKLAISVNKVGWPSVLHIEIHDIMQAN